MEESVISELKSLNNLIKRLIMANCSNHETLASLSAQQMHIIIFIKHAQKHNLDVYQRDIENSFNIRPSTATGIIQLLEKNGYIIKQSVPNDARLKKLVLTDKADSIFHNFEPFIKDIEKVVLEDITEEELDQFANVIHKMKDNLLKDNLLKDK
ncbi:Transcriptional regulator SlyA [bioreactor metagenome]|uniref:Transcriptional regulator SlyA n=1 Tax=bioreactor metagenome TaxID=1076179 RepID=A0A645DLS2_9ZZZZ|nr:MarR family winged helix-turn-helix transcriptional regulator [Candidatus Metalachnospira sp.]